MNPPASLPGEPSGQKTNGYSRSAAETTGRGCMDAVPPPRIGEIVAASPLAARLLPHLMRTLADEIEGATRIAHDAHVPCRHARHNPGTEAEAEVSADTEAVARRVAQELSAGLARHMAGLTGPAGGRAAMPATPRGSEATSRTPRTPRKPRKPPDRTGTNPVYLPGEPTGEPNHGSDKEPATLRHLELRLLGAPEVTLDGKRLEVMDRASRLGLILYMLALHPRGLSAERLAAYIASDSVDLDAFDTDATGSTVWPGTVRTFIWRLRKKAGWYGIVLSPGEMGGCSNMYRLPAGTTCDVWDFERYLDQSARQVLQANVDPAAADQAAALRQEAILLYHGDFCKGVSAGCVTYPAGQLRSRYLQAVLQQAAYWKDKAIRLGTSGPKDRGHGVSALSVTGPGSIEEQKAWLEALSNYRLAVQAEPYDEAAYTGTMQCLAHLGDSKGVRETFARCCRVIQAELGRPPLDSTVHSARKCLALARAG